MRNPEIPVFPKGESCIILDQICSCYDAKTKQQYRKDIKYCRGFLAVAPEGYYKELTDYVYKLELELKKLGR